MPVPGVALQMFSLRDEARADYLGTLRNVAAAGYNAVEAAFGYGGLSAATLRAALDDMGVMIIACHVGIDRLRSNLDEEIEFNLAIGNKNILLAELPLEDRADEAAFHRWAAAISRMGQRCRELGARFSYHSHAFEFRRFGDRTGLEILLGETEPDLVFWEPDVYWLTFAGVDPAAWIARYTERSRLIHLKDMQPRPWPADPIDANAKDLAAHLSTSLGDGTIDETPAIAAATSAEWLIVEQDFSDRPMLDSLARSREHLRKRGY
jgi:sugar phosphate isomerase/epimerase